MHVHDFPRSIQVLTCRILTSRGLHGHLGTYMQELTVKLLGIDSPSFHPDPSPALSQVQRGTHYLLHEDAVVNDIRSAVDSRAKVLPNKVQRCQSTAGPGGS